MDYKQWFALFGDKIFLRVGLSVTTTEGMYQAFKARMLDEMKAPVMKYLTEDEVARFINSLDIEAAGELK